MNTPTHLLLGAAVFGRGGERKLIWAAVIGALLPDLSLYLLAGISLRVLNIPPSRVFDELYFSDLWQGIFAIDNSFIVWGVVLAFAIWRRKGWLIALTSAALLHLALDFPLHHDDGRAHFWPLSNWIYESPVSYWDRGHGAHIVAPIGAALAVASAAVLWWRKPGWVLSVLFGILLAAELMVARVWMFVFSGG
ncbi:MAG: cobalamin biosynthesis protein CobQ [Sulfitobacter sp.]